MHKSHHWFMFSFPIVNAQRTCNNKLSQYEMARNGHPRQRRSGTIQNQCHFVAKTKTKNVIHFYVETFSFCNKRSRTKHLMSANNPSNSGKSLNSQCFSCLQKPELSRMSGTSGFQLSFCSFTTIMVETLKT